MKIRKNENSYNLVCFYPGRARQKAISKSTFRTFIASANRKHGHESSTTLFFPVLVFTFIFKLFIQLHSILRIINVFHWVYKPFIFKIFFQISKLFAREGKTIYTFYLFGGKTERNKVSKPKHWKFKIAMKGIYFFFCIYDNRPWPVFNSQFHAKYFASLTNQNAIFYSIMRFWDWSMELLKSFKPNRFVRWRILPATLRETLTNLYTVYVTSFMTNSVTKFDRYPIWW